LIIAVYVDDLIIASSNDQALNKLKIDLQKCFNMKDLGNLNYCLGTNFCQKDGIITLNQKKYIQDLLTKFNMQDCKTVSTPMEVGTKLEKRTSEEQENLPYQNLIGSLMYLSVASRPDISFAVSYLSQFNNCYSNQHWIAAKRVLRYLKGTMDMNLIYKKTGNQIIGFADADWASCTVDRRSYTGYCFMFAGGIIIWESKKQRTVALSTAKAEYMSLTEASKEAIHSKNLANDMGILHEKILIYNDNQAAQRLVVNPSSKSKHISIKEHFIRDVAQRGDIEICYMRSEEMLADILTKPLPKIQHEFLIRQFSFKHSGS